MSSTFKPNIQAFKADAAIAKGAPVKFGSDSKHVVKANAATDKIIGWSQNAPSAAEDMCEVALPGGGAKVLCGAAAVTRGDLLTADTSSCGLSTNTNADRYAAVAMDSAVSGDLFDAFVEVGIV